MKGQGHAKYDLHHIQYMTHSRKERIEATRRRVEAMLKDEHRDRRQKALECIWCYYNHGMMGQAFTEWNCARCEKEASHPDTGVPFLCESCAKETNLCMYCGGHREGEMVKALP